MGVPAHYLLSIVIPLAFRTFAYYVVFRKLRIHASLLTCIILAGVAVLVGELSIILFFIPITLLIIGAGTYVCAHYTNIPWFPNALLIVASVEIVSHFVLRFIIFPLLL
jgi:hypothetical protein